MSELCEHYGISRPTGYKWVERYGEQGDEGLVELSRAPLTCPHRTEAETEKLVILLKETHGWGARKILKQLRSRLAPSALPCRRCPSGKRA